MEMLLLNKQKFVSVYQGCLDTIYGETYVVVSLSNTNRIINIVGHIIEPCGVIHLIDDIGELVKTVREYLDLTYSVNVVTEELTIAH